MILQYRAETPYPVVHNYIRLVMIYLYIFEIIKLFSDLNITDVVTVVSKLSKACVLRITQNCLVFIVPEEQAIPRRTVLWAVLEQNGFFEHYDMTGVNALEAQNEIFLEFTISK